VSGTVAADLGRFARGRARAWTGWRVSRLANDGRKVHHRATGRWPGYFAIIVSRGMASITLFGAMARRRLP
jgi:hypothetical protein